MSRRSNALADRLESGAQQLMEFAKGLSQAEWDTVCSNEERTVGVLVHHVASAYPVEVDLIQTLASGKVIEGVTWEMVDQMNAGHADSQAGCSKVETLALLQKNSAAAADVIRGLSDEELDKASPVSLNWDAPLTDGIAAGPSVGLPIDFAWPFSFNQRDRVSPSACAREPDPQTAQAIALGASTEPVRHPQQRKQKTAGTRSMSRHRPNFWRRTSMTWRLMRP